MTTELLIAAYIESIHGSAVSDQFTDTFINGESFEDQNDNALKYVLRECKDVLKGNALIDNEDLESYIDRLESYMKNQK
jgi:hypothetical protein